MKGYLRKDGRKGIRNTLVVAYLVECAHHVSREIAEYHPEIETHLIGFPGCYPNDYSLEIMKKLCTHPNVGGVLLVSLGCEGFNREALLETIKSSGRPTELLIIQNEGGTQKTIAQGADIIESMAANIKRIKPVSMSIDELVVGTICGGSDGLSGITANPAVGKCFDKLIQKGSTCIFEETGELIGCEQVMIDRAASSSLATDIANAMEKAAVYYTKMGYGSFSPGNAEGGLTTQEEKSMGAYCKSGDSLIHGLIKPGELPKSNGLYLMDVVPDGEPKYGFPNIADSAEIVELIASGSHLILFTTGRGSVVGSAISPVIKICSNPDTYQKMSDDMDINAGKIVNGESTVEMVGEEIYNKINDIAQGEQSVSEAMKHREFILAYKHFDKIGPSCLNL